MYKKAITTLALLLILPSLTRADVAIITASGLDLLTTDLAISNHHQELNGILVKPEIRYPVKVIGTFGICMLHSHLKKTNPKAAKIFKIGIIVVFSGLAVNNAIQMSKYNNGGK